MSFTPPSGPTDPGGVHLDARLSAYLDGELAPAARREAEAHLAGCPSCQEELDDVAFARSRVRDLHVRGGTGTGAGSGPVPVLAPRRGHGHRAAWAAVAAAAAIVAVMLPSEPEVAPAVPTLVDAHATRASMSGDPLTQLAPIAVPVGFGP